MERSDSNAQATERAFFELSPVIMCITGLADGRVREVNDAFLRLHGYAREEVVGRHVLELGLWIDPTRRDEAIAALRRGEPEAFLVRLRAADHGPQVPGRVGDQLQLLGLHGGSRGECLGSSADRATLPPGQRRTHALEPRRPRSARG